MTTEDSMDSLTEHSKTPGNQNPGVQTSNMQSRVSTPDSDDKDEVHYQNA